MYIQQIINGLNCQVIGCDNPNITSLSCDTSTVKQGCLFFCLKGKKYDGHQFFRKAIGDGAVAIVTQRPLDTSILQIVVDDTRKAMSICAKNFYDCCCDKLKLVAVVGTNGKTSTSYLLNAILSQNGYNTALIGTNGVFFNSQKIECGLTTPDPILLHSLFKQMYQNNVQIVIMEVSAHALALGKVFGLHFDVAIFTNFSQDHLDFFGNMQRYGNVKKSLFCEELVTNAIINVDDSLGKGIYDQMPSVCYGVESIADCYASNVDLSHGATFRLHLFGESGVVNSKLSGMFNVYNILSACSCASVMGLEFDKIVNAVERVESIEGRNQTLVRNDGVKVVIDFAHTPDGVQNILAYLRNDAVGQLIVVFGCGGNRDKFKRPVMAEIVSKYADFAIVTNDNPRYEDPKIITQDITSRLHCKHRVILNRSQATEYALSIASSGDVVAILGKGAEKYQEIKGRKYPYSDFDVVSRLINT